MEMLLNGNWVDREETFEVRDPADGTLIDTVPRASAADMRVAIDAAVGGSRISRELPAHRRTRILHRVATIICEQFDEFAETIAREGVKTIREARREVERAVHTMRLAADESSRVTGETLAFDQQPGGENRFGYWVRQPLGIIGALTPFNDPLNLVAHKVGPGLAAGNAVIVKPDSKTPLSALRLARAIDEAGMPAGIVQCVTGPGSVIGDILVTDERVRMISFTGGLEVGRIIAGRAGLKKLGMELGSNSPVIIMPDADLDAALAATVSGAFWAAGQNCLHVQRLLLHEDVYDELADRFVAAAETLVVGDKLDEATDMGPMIDEAAAANVERLVEGALAAGARLRTGGTREGTFFSPTVLEQLPEDCELAREEVYGPVTILYRFATLEEAIARANDADYGLHAAIFTRDVETALRAAEELDCGGVMINDSTDYRMDAMPFGGVKGSGLGREGVKFAVAEMSEPKTICFSRG